MSGASEDGHLPSHLTYLLRMSVSSRTTRIRIVTGTSAVLAGLAWVAKDVGGRVSPDPDYWDCNSSYDYVLNGVDTVAFLTLALTLLGLRRLFRNVIGKTSALLGTAASAGFLVAGLANLLEHCASLDALGFSYVIGLMLGMLLLVGLTLSLRRTPIARWLVWLLLLGAGAGILLFTQGGLVAFGGAWFVLGVVLIQTSKEKGLA